MCPVCGMFLDSKNILQTVMPIIMSSRVIQMVAACGTWCFGLWVVSLVWSCRLCVRFAGCFSTRETSYKPLCPSSGAQEFYRWLPPVVLGALVYGSFVWCGAVGYVSGLWDVS